MVDAKQIQKNYYARTACDYDDSHTEEEHIVALNLLAAFIEFLDIRSVLDVGAGTGRAMRFLRKRFPDLAIKGLEPVAELRKIGHSAGIPEVDLVDGDGAALPFDDSTFDLVCEFAVLHHVGRPESVVDEMNRVARKAVAISDANFMGQGSSMARILKFGLYACGLWPLANFAKTKGKGYSLSEGDGLAYSYTVFQNLPQLRANWKRVNVISTAGRPDGTLGIRTSAPHLLAIGWDGIDPANG